LAFFAKALPFNYGFFLNPAIAAGGFCNKRLQPEGTPPHNRKFRKTPYHGRI